MCPNFAEKIVLRKVLSHFGDVLVFAVFVFVFLVFVAFTFRAFGITVAILSHLPLVLLLFAVTQHGEVHGYSGGVSLVFSSIRIAQSGPARSSSGCGISSSGFAIEAVPTQV